MHMHVHTEDVLPFIPWLRRYNRHYLKADLFAGLTVAVVALPQSMAYAIIAGLPVEYRTSLLAFYLTNLFYEEALSLLERDAGVAGFLRMQGCSVDALVATLQAAV